MSLDTPALIAIIGAGPIGLEAALYARFLGYDVQVLERDVVAARWRGDDAAERALPVGKCCSPLGLRALMCQDAGWSPPPLDTLWTPRELAESYLLPLSRTDLLDGHVAEQSTVVDIRRLDEESLSGRALAPGASPKESGADEGESPELSRSGERGERGAGTVAQRWSAPRSPEERLDYAEPHCEEPGAGTAAQPWSARPLTESDDDAEYEYEEPRLPPLRVTARCGETTRTVDADIVIDASGMTDGEADWSFLAAVNVERSPQTGCPLSCGDAARHGAAAGLVLPESNLYILGSKSQGKGAELTITDGLRQIRDLFALIGGRATLDLYGVR